jgi:hypothetical protein
VAVAIESLACPDATIQWEVDGTPVAGAVDLTLPLSALAPGAHSFAYTAICAGPPVVAEISATATLTVPPAMSGRVLAGSVLVSRGPSGLRLDWGDVPTTPRFNVDAGTIGRWYDHVPLACAVPQAAGGSRASLDVAMPVESAYYLVSPADCAAEGSVG